MVLQNDTRRFLLLEGCCGFIGLCFEANVLPSVMEAVAVELGSLLDKAKAVCESVNRSAEFRFLSFIPVAVLAPVLYVSPGCNDDGAL